MDAQTKNTLTIVELHRDLTALLAAQPQLGNVPAVIPLVSSTTRIGAHAVTGLRAVAPGIDWDAGKVFLWPATPVGEDVATVEATRQQCDIVGAALYKAKRILRDDKLTESQKLDRLVTLLESGVPGKGRTAP